MRVRHIFLGTSKLGTILIFFAAVTCLFGFHPASAAVVGLDAVHFYNTYWGRYNLYSGANYGGLRNLITDEPPLGLGHEIVPLTEFNTGELAGVDVAVFLISTIGSAGDQIPYTDDQIAAIQAFALKGAVFLSDSTMLSTYMAYGDNAVLAENIINYLVGIGGGVLFIADNNGDESWACDIDNWNELVAPFGIEYSLPLPDHNYPETWIYDFVEHPITEGVSVLRVLSYPKNTIVWPSQDLTVNISPEDVLAVYPFLVGEVDGTVDPSAFTSQIWDDVYGHSAGVVNFNVPWNEFPTEPTEVTLYVTDEPPAGMPVVVAQGTYFMNIQFDPEPPSYPTEPMGLDVILPLLEPLPFSTVIDLMRLDPHTGELVPALEWGRTCVNPLGCPEFSWEGDLSHWEPVLFPADCYVMSTPSVQCPPDLVQDEGCGNRARCSYIATFSTVVGVVPDEITVQIDIMPGEGPNSINMKKKGVVTVAILGSPAFDVDIIDMIAPETLNFHGASPKHDLMDPETFADHLEDVNGDGFMDLVIHFNTQDIGGLDENSTDGCLQGSLKGGQSFEGCDSVRCK